MSGSLYRLLLPDPGLRLFVVEGRSAVDEARTRHQLTAGSTLPLGRALMGASLLAWDAKSGHRITLQFKSQGPIGGVVADARPDGSVRGYVHVPQLAFPIADVPRIAHAALGNRGAAQLVRETESGLSTGQVELVTGGIDRDIEALIGASDGERCAVGLGVFVAPGADEESFEITGATGAMVMALPDADPYAFDAVARRVRALSDTPWEGSITDLVSTLAGSYRHETMAMQAFRFECPCTTEAVARVLISLGPEELISMALDPGHAEIVCHYCNHAYRFEEQALRLMADDLQPIEDAPLGEA